jgi:RNA polymerase II elongation factor ELL
MPVTSAPTSVPTSQQLKTPRLEALRTPLIHLLAVGPNTLKGLSRKTGCSTEDCNLLLQKFGKEARSGEGKWVLTDRAYKELDVWNFRYPSDDDRKAAIDNAISAFGRLRLGREDKQWQLLLPRKERGKGKVLSRLGTARKAETLSNKTQDPVEDGPTSVSRAGTDGEEMARTKSQQTTKKKVSEREAITKRLLSKNPSKTVRAPVKVTQKKIAKPKKKESSTLARKIKSAEYVIDESDSDVEMEDAPAEKISDTARPKIENDGAKGSVTVAQKLPKVPEKIKILAPKVRVTAKTNNPPPQATSSKTAPRSSNDMPKFSSISGSTKPSPPSTKTPTPLAKTSPQATPKLLPQQSMKALSQPMGTSRSSIKEKLGNSPRKPSPLGASPPENASDSAPSIPSNSSSPLNSQASKGQSTPTPGPIRKSIEQRTSSDRQATSSASSASHKNRPAPQTEQALKRKADQMDRRDPARQSRPNRRAEESNKRRQLQATPPPSMSESSSVSPPPYDYYTLEKAQRFKKIYSEYIRLHEELSHTNNPPAEKIKEITNMHSRLSRMKMDLYTTVVS